MKIDLEKLKADPILFFETLLDINSTDVQKELLRNLPQGHPDTITRLGDYKSKPKTWFDKFWEKNQTEESMFVTEKFDSKPMLSEEFIKGIKDKFTEEHQRFRTHVLGEFLPIKAEKEKNVETKKS